MIFLPYLQNAHLYHFTFESLSQILLSHGFELVFGNEKIETVFRKSSKTNKVLSNSQLAEQSIQFIHQLDSRRGRLYDRTKRIKISIIRTMRTILEILHLKEPVKRILKR